MTRRIASRWKLAGVISMILIVRFQSIAVVLLPGAEKQVLDDMDELLSTEINIQLPIDLGSFSMLHHFAQMFPIVSSWLVRSKYLSVIGELQPLETKAQATGFPKKFGHIPSS